MFPQRTKALKFVNMLGRCFYCCWLVLSNKHFNFSGCFPNRFISSATRTSITCDFIPSLRCLRNAFISWLFKWYFLRESSHYSLHRRTITFYLVTFLNGFTPKIGYSVFELVTMKQVVSHTTTTDRLEAMGCVSWTNVVLKSLATVMAPLNSWSASSSSK